jgi:hypothetical protein
MNREGLHGRSDWRMPNRRELRSLIDHGQSRPALPAGHPFREVFLGWVWSSTTKAGQPGYAWNTHLEGGRTFYSRKDEERLLWPVRGESAVLAQTGQAEVYGEAPGQDGALRMGVGWPGERIVPTARGVADRLTGIEWSRPADGAALGWEQARELAAAHAAQGWRLPDINELESLVDAGRADPTLCGGVFDGAVPEGLWSATTSGFDPAWAFVLYADKGAVGVGFKANRDFDAWLVRPQRRVHPR